MDQQTLELVRAKQALDLFEARFANVMDTVHDAVISIDEQQRIVLFNQGAERMFGYGREEIVGQHLSVLLPVRFHLRHAAHVERFGSGDSGTRLMALDRTEVNGRRRNGEEFPAEVSISSLRHGNVSYFTAVVRDATERQRAQDAARFYATRFSNVLDTVHDGVISIDEQQTIVVFNQGAERIFGYSREEIIGKKISDLLPTRFHKQHASHVQEFGDSGSGARIMALDRTEVTGRRKNGDEFPAEVSISSLMHGDQRLFTAVIRDATDRKRVQEAVRFFERRFYNVLDTVHDGVISIDEQQTIVLFNQGAERMFGYSRSEIVGRNLTLLLPARFHKQHATHIQEFGASGSGARLMALDRTEVTGRRKNGDEFPAEVSISSLMHGDQRLFTAVIRDATDRKRAQEELQVSEERFRSLILGVTDYAIYMLDPQGVVVSWNQGAESINGYTSEEVMGLDFSVFYPADEVERSDPQLNLRLAIRDGHYVGAGWRVRKDSTRFWAEEVITALRSGDNQLLGFSVITRDVTERITAENILQEAYEKEKELSTLKSRIVTVASHEFRTPLAVILSASESLLRYRDRFDATKIDNKLISIAREIRHLTHIIEEVLDLGKLQSGHFAYTPVEIDLDALCHSIITEFTEVPDIAHHLQYTSDYAPLLISVDERLMRTVITNLISNAIKYSPSRTTVYVHLTVEGRSAILQVRDEGIGIPENDLANIFQPFLRASNVGVISGTGLGLTIIREAITLHGGTINVTSVLGTGTTFTISLPLPNPYGA